MTNREQEAQAVAKDKQIEMWRKRALEAEAHLTQAGSTGSVPTEMKIQQLQRLSGSTLAMLVLIANTAETSAAKANRETVVASLYKGPTADRYGGKDAADDDLNRCLDELRAYGLVEPGTPPGIIVITKRGRELIEARCRVIYDLRQGG